jgi:hypothetical protein
MMAIILFSAFLFLDGAQSLDCDSGKNKLEYLTETMNQSE